MHRKAFLALVMVCCLSVAAYADITVTPGTWTINPAAGQSTDAITALPIEILISNDGNVGLGIQGVNLALVVGDQVSTPPVQPQITAMDLIGAGTLFNASNTGQGGATPPPGAIVIQSTTTLLATPYLIPAGTLAFMTFDATGVAPGSYGLQLFNTTPPVFPPFTTNFPSDQALGTLNLNLGTVNVIPEPGSIVLGLFAAAGLCAVVIRRRRRKVT